MAATIPIINSSFKRNGVTMVQINAFEDVAENSLQPDGRLFSAKYWELLADYRNRPVAKDTAKILSAL